MFVMTRPPAVPQRTTSQRTQRGATGTPARDCAQGQDEPDKAARGHVNAAVLDSRRAGRLRGRALPRKPHRGHHGVVATLTGAWT